MYETVGAARARVWVAAMRVRVRRPFPRGKDVGVVVPDDARRIAPVREHLRFPGRTRQADPGEEINRGDAPWACHALRRPRASATLVFGGRGRDHARRNPRLGYVRLGGNSGRAASVTQRRVLAQITGPTRRGRGGVRG